MNTPLRRLAVVITLLFLALLGSTTNVQVIQAGQLNARPGNARALYKEFGRNRGPILVDGNAIAQSVPVKDAYTYLRQYPAGSMYSAVTGYFSSVLYSATGLEQATDSWLSGTSDRLLYRRIQDILTGHQPSGAAVELTLDPAAQKAAWDALGDQRGAAVAIRPSTGEILALVSKPGFDPNTLASHDSHAVRTAAANLSSDAGRPLDNRAIAGRGYPPGSTFKLITAAAALSSGRWHATTPTIEGPAVLDLPGTRADLPNEFSGACGPGGKTTMLVALRISCNTAFGWLGMQLGEQALADQAAKFGFGQELELPLKVTPSTFPSHLTSAQVAQSAIGQFDVRVTPLQIAMVTAGIANKGVVMKPNLIRSVRSTTSLDVISKPAPQVFSTAVTPQVAAELTQMMVDVVQNGTGRSAQIPGISVAGKTGTAQQDNGRSPHAWFTAFAPVDNPQVAVAVVVEDGGSLGDATSGGRAAAPIAKKIIEAVVR